MKSLPLVGAAALSLSLSPLAMASAADQSLAISSRLPVHKALTLLHVDGETCVRSHSLTTQPGTGAFLELTAAAP